MRVRWIGLTLVLLAIGLAAGYGAGMLTRAEPTTLASAAEPVPAQSPSIPVQSQRPFAPDIGYPALEPGLDYSAHVIGGPNYRWSYAVPNGWTPEPITFGEVRWRPADEPDIGGFSLRVKMINDHLTSAQMVAQKKAAVESIYDDVEIIDETKDLLYFSYRDLTTDRQRFNTFGWFMPAGSTIAAFEMSVVGRSVDIDGLKDLFGQVSESIHREPAP